MLGKLFLYGALALGVAAPASASEVIVSSYNPIDSAGYTSFNIGGYGYYAGPVVLSTNRGDLLAYCIDLFHDLSSSGHYNFAPFTKDGDGHDLTPSNINHIAAIANWGFDQWKHGNGLAAAAAQIAIWSVEYSIPATVNDLTEKGYFDQLVNPLFNFADGHSVRALLPDPYGSTQQMLVQTAVPEPSTWAMMIIGFVGVGFLAYRKNTKPVLIAV